MSDTKTVHFRNADGRVEPVTLPAPEAVTACHKHPHEWSLDGKTFADPAPAPGPATHPGGLNPLAGVGHAFPHPSAGR
jgi:hypothetical protein